MRVSKLQLYSIGIVAANKALDSNIIEVTPIEDSPMLNGEINSEISSETIDSVDSQGVQFKVKMDSANSVQAEWLPMGNGNRKTSPDVRRGAQVVLYHFADPKKLYWMTLMEDLHLRRLETVVWAFSATKNEEDSLSGDTYYYLEVSTHKKLVHFHTTKKNGEPYSYDIQINTDEGYIKFQDDAGNWIILDSKEKQIAMNNADGAYFDLNKKNLTINVPETYTLRAKNVVEDVKEAIKTKAGNAISSETKDHSTKASNVAVNGSSAVTVKGGAVTITGAPVSVN